MRDRDPAAPSWLLEEANDVLAVAALILFIGLWALLFIVAATPMPS